MCSSGNEDGFFIIDLDVVIDPTMANIGFPTNANKINMRNSLKHELGHALMINHAVIPNVISVVNQSIVYYSFTATSSGGITVPIKANDIEGANLVFTNSAQIVGSSCGVAIQHSSSCGDPCLTTGIANIDQDLINIYPNPAQNYIFIKKRNITEKGNITLYNQTGRIVLEKNISETPEIFIPLDLPGGIYLLKYQSIHHNFIQKIVIL